MSNFTKLQLIIDASAKSQSSTSKNILRPSYRSCHKVSPIIPIKNLPNQTPKPLKPFKQDQKYSVNFQQDFQVETNEILDKFMDKIDIQLEEKRKKHNDLFFLNEVTNLKEIQKYGKLLNDDMEIW